MMQIQSSCQLHNIEECAACQAGPIKTYPLDVLCGNCGYRGERELPKGERRTEAKVVCPCCECVDLKTLDHCNRIDCYRFLQNYR